MNDQRVGIPPSWVGLAVGLFLGYIAVRFGVARLLIVALFGLIGYGFSAFRQGELDLVEGVSRLQGRSRTL